MGWITTTFDVIDWDIFCFIYHKQAKNNMQWINKFCLQNLQMEKQLHQIDSCEVIQCCLCGASTENDDHPFQCKKRSTFLQRIQKELKKYKNEVDLKLCHLLLEGRLVEDKISSKVQPGLYLGRCFE